MGSYELVVVISAPSPFSKERYCLGAAGDLQLAQDVAYIILNGLVTEVDLTGNLAVGLTISDQLQDLLLLVGQLRENVFFLAAANSIEDVSSDCWVKQGLAGPYLADGVDNLLGANLLEQITRGTGHNGAHDRFFIAV